jgi:hypothetical protein
MLAGKDWKDFQSCFFYLFSKFVLSLFHDWWPDFSIFHKSQNNILFRWGGGGIGQKLDITKTKKYPFMYNRYSYFIIKVVDEERAHWANGVFCRSKIFLCKSWIFRLMQSCCEFSNHKLRMLLFYKVFFILMHQKSVRSKSLVPFW